MLVSVSMFVSNAKTRVGNSSWRLWVTLTGKLTRNRRYFVILQYPNKMSS